MILTTLMATAALAGATPASPPTGLHELEHHHSAGAHPESLQTSLRRSYPAGTPVADVARSLVAKGGLCSPLKGTGQSCGLMQYETHRGEHRQVIWTVRLKGDDAGALKTLSVARNTWSPPPSL